MLAGVTSVAGDACGAENNGKDVEVRPQVENRMAHVSLEGRVEGKWAVTSE